MIKNSKRRKLEKKLNSLFTAICVERKYKRILSINLHLEKLTIEFQRMRPYKINQPENSQSTVLEIDEKLHSLIR